MRAAVPAILNNFGIDVVSTVSSDVDLRHACERHTPDCALIELDNTDCDVAQLCDDLRRRHQGLRVVGVGRADIAVDAKLPAAGDLETLAAAVHGRIAAPRSEQPERLSLTRRQVEVLSLISQGRSAEQIASTLQVSTSTIAYHKREIFSRLGAQSQAQAVRTAMQHGLLLPVDS